MMPEAASQPVRALAPASARLRRGFVPRSQSVPTTILAVDDSATMRKALAITFAGTEFNLVACDGAAAALEKVKTEQPALVIVDVSLPPTDGYELCTTIKLAAPHLPVLMLSSKHSPFDAAKGSQADGHVDKPFDTQMLADKVRELVAAGARPGARPAAAASPPAAAAQPTPARPPVAAAAAAPAPAAAGSRPKATAIGPSPLLGGRPAAGQPTAGPARMGPFSPPAAAGPAASGPASPTFKDTIPMAGKATQDAAAQARAGVAATRQAAQPEARPAAPAAKPVGGGGLGGWARPAPPAKPAAAAPQPAETPAPAPAAQAEPETSPRGRTVGGTLPGVPMQSGPGPVVKAQPAAAIRRNTVSSWPAPAPKEGAPDVQVPRAAAVAKDVAAATEGLESRLGDLGLSAEQIQGVLALSREVVERVVWEVVPTLAETIIKEEIARLTQD
jgi:CheY-like chemotaxis protein